ncbi:MAG TPA: hypothetical protein VEW08_01905, partial [Steroidobacteraceae bacterium]|nr:hypothetical protein [Steroidobacteraceae bacterium]
ALTIDVDPGDPEELRDANLDERTDVELHALNAKGVPVTLEIRHYAYVHTRAKISKSSQRAFRKYGDFAWRLRVPANGRKVLAYRFEQPSAPDTDDDE